MTVTECILIAQSIASGAMCGIIWFVQVVHYPLFARADGAAAAEYARENQRRTGRVVIPFMLIEGFTSAAIAWMPPSGVPVTSASVGVMLVAAVWLSTAAVQMPLHARLAREGHAPDAIGRLVRSNWLRTVLWSARAALAAWMLSVAA